MKKNLLFTTSFLLTFIFTLTKPTVFFAQNTGIFGSTNLSMNNTGVHADPSAIFDISSQTGGLLIPRMTQAQRDAIQSPANSLLIFNNTTGCMQVYNTATNFWENIFCFSNCTSAPAAPVTTGGGLILGQQKTCFSFLAIWGDQINVAGTFYYLDVATDVSFTNFVNGIHNFNVYTNFNYNVSGLNPSTTYYYRVRAYNSCGFSSYANTNSVTTRNLVTPGTPVADAATDVLSSHFAANWEAVPYAVGYYLDVAADAGFTSILANYNNTQASGTSYNFVDALTCNSTYYYRVRAANDCMSGSNSNTISVTTLSNPLAPVAVGAANILQTSFDARWSITESLVDLYIDIATDTDFTFFVPGYNNFLVNTADNSILYVPGLACSTTYYFRFRQVNSCAVSGNSNVVSVTTAPC